MILPPGGSPVRLNVPSSQYEVPKLQSPALIRSPLSGKEVKSPSTIACDTDQSLALPVMMAFLMGSSSIVSKVMNRESR